MVNQNKIFSFKIKRQASDASFMHKKRVMSDCDPKGWIFLSAPNIYERFFFLHTFHFRKWVFDNAVTSIADVNHIVMTIQWRLVTSFLSVTSNLTTAYRDSRYNQFISNTWKFSIFIFPTARLRVCEIKFASTSVICGNPYPECKNERFYQGCEG